MRHKNIATEVLLVDDNPGDTDLIADLLLRYDRSTHSHCVRDGVEAMAFLRCEGRFSGALRPHLIMLDLNMPRKDGWAVIVDVKSDGVLKTIPIVVFTASEARMDIARCYDLGANCYVTKPTNLNGYIVAVREIANYWFNFASVVGLEGQ